MLQPFQAASDKGHMIYQKTVNAHGLYIEQHTTYGWTITTLTEEAAAWLAAQLGIEDITASRKTLLQITTTSGDEEDSEAPTKNAIRGGRQTSKNTSIKYVCPVCGAIIRATKQDNVLCGDYKLAFEKM